VSANNILINLRSCSLLDENRVQIDFECRCTLEKRSCSFGRTLVGVCISTECSIPIVVGLMAALAAWSTRPSLECKQALSAFYRRTSPMMISFTLRHPRWVCLSTFNVSSRVTGRTGSRPEVEIWRPPSWLWNFYFWSITGPLMTLLLASSSFRHANDFVVLSSHQRDFFFGGG